MRRRRFRRDPAPAADGLLADAMIAARGPVEVLLTSALRRFARRRPEAFARLGACRTTTIRLAPRDVPVAFDLTPDGARGRVRVVRRDAHGPCAAVVSARLVDLLAVFDGGLDADAAFFARSLQVDGDVAAVMALRNVLESAEIGLADLAPLPFGHAAANRLLRHLLSVARRARGPLGA
jgi:predicted lipid carrier protein YhbT